ncbi:MAG: hypothetical protein QOE70_4047 [Chthoniobacter sp.]|jgi:hypothetical protein|nr:hypothetical protein [Chthoniobacter sp.]
MSLDPATTAAAARAKKDVEPPALEPSFPYDERRLAFDPLYFGLDKVVELKPSILT